jgi:hypothetical protein
MRLINDPDHWFAQKEGDDAVAVQARDGEDGRLFSELTDSELRSLRNALDKGEESTDPLVCRDYHEVQERNPAIVARTLRHDAPRIKQEYPALRSAIEDAKFSVTFDDIEVLHNIVSEPVDIDDETNADLLTCIAGARLGQRTIPLPETVESHPEPVSAILDVPADSVRSHVIHEYLLGGTVLITAPPDGTTSELAWLDAIGWIEGSEYTDVGRVAQEYATADSETRVEIEAAAILSVAHQEGGLLVSNRLEKAIAELNITEDPYPESISSILSSGAQAAAHQRAIAAAETADALRVSSSLSVDGPGDIQDAIRRCRSDRLEEIINGLEQIPLYLFEGVNPADMPAQIQAVRNGIKPDSVIEALDTAIVEREQKLDATIDQIESLSQLVGPLLSASEATRLEELPNTARSIRGLLSPSSPETPADCINLYDAQLQREQDSNFEFSQCEREAADAVLKECEEYIRSSYQAWAHSDRRDRDVEMIVDTPDLLTERFQKYDHILLMISDGFGLRQWIEARHTVPRIQQWEEADAISNTPMTTIFPSETGAGHYSFLTGQFPEEHGRDDIGKTIDTDSVALFDRARDVGAHVQVYTYLPSHNGGFRDVLKKHADDLETLEGLRAESAALTKDSQQRIASTIAQHDCTLTVLQHNQVDQIHEGSDHIADTLVSGVARDVVEYIDALASRLTDDVGVVLTADHGMIRTNDSRVDITRGEGKAALKQMDEWYDGDRLGQRVTGLKSKSKSQGSFVTNKTEYFEILPKQTMRKLRALTDDKCRGRSLRMRRRYYSEGGQMTATHGAFTFDEMFIPFVEFDLAEIDQTSE